MNADWHRSHPMPKNPTEAQRIAWHWAHAIACGCRPIPAKLAERMSSLGLEVPSARPKQ